jgi:hypothetical protein
MPCADGGRPYEDSGLERRNTELAQRLCRMGIIISKLYNGQQVDHNEMMWALRIHKEHRQTDQRTALREANTAALTLDANILKIRALGGEPRKEILDNYEKAKSKALAIANSDPLTTDLY